MIKISKVNYSIYGECLEISNGKIVMKVTTDIGPRIIYYGTTDGRNIMYEDLNDDVNNGGEYFDKNYGKDVKWHIYGGHRLWKSPEDLASYYPDNNKVEVEIKSNGAVFTSQKELTTGLQKSIEVIMADSGEIEVIHNFYNYTDKAVDYSLWGLSVSNKGGVAYIPLSTVDTGLLPNRNFVFWPYADVNDHRLTIKQDGLILRQDPNADKPFKIGLLNTEGKAFYLYEDKLVEKTYEKAAFDGNYPDYSCSTELYTSPLILEVESISELKHIEPGKTVTAKEKWMLHTADDAKYKEIKEKINKD